MSQYLALLTSLLPRAVFGDVLPVSSSVLSHIITEVQVGPYRERVLVALTFDSTESVLYDSNHCPPFVECYEAPVDEILDPNSDSTWEWAGGFRFEGQPAYTDIQFAFVPAPVNLDYLYVSASEFRSVEFRDTAGIIGVSPYSLVTEDISIHIAAATTWTSDPDQYDFPVWEIEFKPSAQLPPLEPGQVEVIGELLDDGRHEWIASGHISVGEFSGSTEFNFSFIPNLNDLQVPNSIEIEFIDALTRGIDDGIVVDDGRWFVPCSKLGEVDFSSWRSIKLSLDGSGDSVYIEILPSSLLYSGKLSFDSMFSLDKRRYCPTRLVFVTGPTCRLGVPLFTSVRSVVLDDIEGVVRIRSHSPPGFRSKRRPRVTPFTVPLHSVPSFQFPRTVDHEDGSVEILVESGWESPDPYELYLYKPWFMREQLNGIDYLDFTKRRKSLAPDSLSMRTQSGPRRSTHALEGVFHPPTVSLSAAGEPGVVSLLFKRNVNVRLSSFKIALIENKNSLSISMREVESMIPVKYFRLPSPTSVHKHAGGEEEASCVVCQDSIRSSSCKTAVPQQLECCRNWFHSDCIFPWIQTTGACALCRQAVPLTTSPKKIRLVERTKKHAA